MKYDTRRALDLLRSSIDVMLQGAGIDTTVHSIQLLTVTGNALSHPVSYLLSREPQKLLECISNFTHFERSTKTFKRSLASIDIDTAPYRINDLSTLLGHPGATAVDPHEFASLEGWKYCGPNEPDNDAYEDWIEALNASFPGLGSTMWVTQRSSASDGEPKSSAFVLFSKSIQNLQTPRLYQISKLLRDALVTEVVSRHRAIIEQQMAWQETYLNKILSEDSSEMPIAPEVAEQIDIYFNALIGNVPILISGEAGAGKLGVAKEVYRWREAYLRARAGDSSTYHAEKKLKLIRVATLPGSPKEIVKTLGDELGMNAAPAAALVPSQVVILDDIHVASPAAQEVLCRMLDRFIPSGEPLELDASKVKFIFTTPPGLDAVVASGAFSASLYSQISAFEIVCPPLRDRLSVPSDRDEVLNYAVKAISQALDLHPPAVLTPTDVEHIQKQQWPGNFRDLNNFLIRLLLERARKH